MEEDNSTKANSSISSEESVGLYMLYKETVYRQYQDNKRLFIFNFSDSQCLLSWLQSEHKNKDNITLTSLSWDEWDNLKTAILGEHNNTILKAKNISNGIAILIFAKGWFCSVTAIAVSP